MNNTTAQRILVAEDNRVLSRIVEFNLKQAGYDVTVVFDGQSAIDRAAAEEFDLMVVDYQMPGFSGIEVCRTVRSKVRNAETPFIFCTAKAYELDRDGLNAELNIARFIAKPFSPRELVEAVTETIGEAVSVG